MESLDVLKVKFTHSNTVRDKKPYTIYEIEVRSSSTITWVIYKRYSAFYALHQELMKTNLLSAEQKALLPLLPPKRLTRSLAVEFVEKRKQELQDYLRAILDTPGMVHCAIILSFLEVPDSVRPMLGQKDRTTTGLGGMDLKDGVGVGGIDNKMGGGDPFTKQSYASRNYEERRVIELINLLKYHPNKVAAIKSFEDYFFDQRPRLSAEFIRYLLQGKNGSEGDGGLVQTCGDINYSHVASRAALYLLCRLLDVEKNKDASLFVEQFCSLDPSVLRRMQLHQHIISERGNRLGAFRIINILRQHWNGRSLLSSTTPAPASNASSLDHTIEQIVNDQWAIREYCKWAERTIDSVVIYSNEPQDLILKSLSLDVGYKNIAHQTFNELFRSAADESGWRIVEPMASLSAITSSPSSPSSSSLTDVNNQVIIGYKKDTVRDTVLVRITAIFPYKIDAVAKLLIDIKKRKDWDLKFHKGKRLQVLDGETDVAHLVFKSFSSPYKYRDFCLMRSWTQLEGGAKLLAARSVMHPLVPEGKENVRAVLFPTGYLLTPLTGQLSDIVAPPNNNNNPSSLSTSPSTNINNVSRTPAANRFAFGPPPPPPPPSTNPSVPPSLNRLASSPIAAVATGPIASPVAAAAAAGVGGGSGVGGGVGVGGAGGGTSLGTIEEACLFTMIASMDKESVLIVSPDLLGETNELRQSINNIRSVLGREHGYRILRSSLHTQNLSTTAKTGLFQNPIAGGRVHTTTPSQLSRPIIGSPPESGKR